MTNPSLSLSPTLIELNETSVEDNDFYIRESRDMVTVIQNLLQAGKDRRVYYNLKMV